jgi:hypothetical protein
MMGALGLLLGSACGARSELDAPIGGGGPGGSMPLGGGSCDTAPTMDACAQMLVGGAWWNGGIGFPGCGCWKSAASETYGVVGFIACTADGACRCYRNGVYILTCMQQNPDACTQPGCCGAVVPR